MVQTVAPEGSSATSILSNISKVSLLYGLAISVDAAIKSREQKVAERYRQTLGMPYS